MTRSRPGTSAAAVCALLCLVASACTWSVPADPGRNARARARPRAATEATDGAPAKGRPQGADDGMRSVYLSRCGRCHEPYAPEHASAAEWPSIVRRMAPRAGVFGAERERLLAWLTTRAR